MNAAGANRELLLDRPEIIKVSLTNICNYRCVMCYNPGLRQMRGFIKEDLLWRIMEECVEAGIGKISLGATGEPLLHPKFADFLVRAKQQGLWVSTNNQCQPSNAGNNDNVVRAWNQPGQSEHLQCKSR